MSLASGTIGAGGMGEVYRSLDTRLDRTVAIKILPESFANDADRLQRFEHEARVLSALNHPNLLSIFDVGTQGGIHANQSLPIQTSNPQPLDCLGAFMGAFGTQSGESS